jgi:hypothetical protein
MHAARIIQDLLNKKCASIHAKRRQCIAKLVEAGRKSGLSLLRMSRALGGTAALRHRIKCCDRLLSNPHLLKERGQIYRAMNDGVLPRQNEIGIIIDWSDLRPDGSAHLLRAAAIVKGRAFVVYEEVYAGKDSGSSKAHRQFLTNLRTVIPAGCRPVLITDAGFRATWFKLASDLGFEWVGRIRNRDLVCAEATSEWVGCKTLYSCATGRPKSLGRFTYVQSNPTACRLVAFKQQPKGRHHRNKFGKPSRSTQSLKSRTGQIEPWLLAVSPGLASLSATKVVALYAGRMQIEQTFRDVKNGKWGLGLTDSQTKKLQRLTALLLLGALITYALWLIGLAARQQGCRVAYGSKKKASTTLSIISLAQYYLNEIRQPYLSKRQINDALSELASMVMTVEI